MRDPVDMAATEALQGALQNLGLVVNLLLNLGDLCCNCLALLLHNLSELPKLLLSGLHALPSFLEPCLELVPLSLEFGNVDLQTFDIIVGSQPRWSMLNLFLHLISNCVLEM